MSGGDATTSCAGPEGPWDPAGVAAAAQLAGVLEVAAEKPGNVTPRHDFPDMSFEAMVRSAIALGPELARAGERGVGDTVLGAVRATRRVAAANTNLGIVLLLAPLARAALTGAGPLRDRLRVVLGALDVDDARAAYAAIRLAAPGGLGTAAEHDVGAEPEIGLRAAMAAAAGRDRIAAEYAGDFALTFAHGLPALEAALAAGLAPRAAIAELFLGLLAAFPDTLIARKRGAAEAARVSAGAASVVAAGGVRTAAGRRALADLDAALRTPDHALNPGTTADLCAAVVFVGALAGSL